MPELDWNWADAAQQHRPNSCPVLALGDCPPWSRDSVFVATFLVIQGEASASSFRLAWPRSRSGGKVSPAPSWPHLSEEYGRQLGAALTTSTSLALFTLAGRPFIQLTRSENSVWIWHMCDSFGKCWAAAGSWSGDVIGRLTPKDHRVLLQLWDYLVPSSHDVSQEAAM